MPYVRCYCKTNNCGGNLTAVNTARSHGCADLRQTTISSQAQFKRVGQRILQNSRQLEDIGPVSRQFAVLLHEPPAPLSPHLDFADPNFEPEILDLGNLTYEDL